MEDAASMSQHSALEGAERDGMYRRRTGCAWHAPQLECWRLFAKRCAVAFQIPVLPLRNEVQAPGSLMPCATIKKSPTINQEETHGNESKAQNLVGRRRHGARRATRRSRAGHHQDRLG